MQPFILAAIVLALALLATLLLWRGDTPRITVRSELLEIEERLAALAFPPGAVDGIADAATETAIRAFQQAAGLPADGRASPALLDELRALAGDE
ncbi:peptidoglycan-binding protein [Dongia sp.]|uniref:peptidoglycan-binding domain-containing protein n=1 Tax=Dongia sp. TaxID=1977262 RepID=UPI0035B45055